MAELVAAGWRVASDAPMWCFLPAVWLEHLCRWVPDRLPRFSWSRNRDEGLVITPWTADVADDIHRSNSELLERVGLEPLPAGRIWLLRSPWPTICVERVQALIGQRAHELGYAGYLDEVLVAAAREVLSWSEEQIWDWWPGERGDTARAWRAHGRVGEDAAPLIAAAIGPDLLAEYEARGLTAKAAVEWTSTLYAYGREGLELAGAWIDLGLNPSDIGSLYTVDPAEVRVWLAEGFDLEDVRVLKGLALERARAWRAAGFSARQVSPLLDADLELSPAEAAAFTDAGIEDPVPWVELGFDAAVARGWIDLDVVPNEARVWRAGGHDPASAAPLLATLPADAPRVPGGSYAIVWPAGGAWMGSSAEMNERDVYYASVHDPPGTRGRAGRPFSDP